MKKTFVIGMIIGSVIAIYFYWKWRQSVPQKTREEKADLFAKYINEIELGANRKKRELTQHEQTLIAHYETKLNDLGFTYMQEGQDAFAIPML